MAAVMNMQSSEGNALHPFFTRTNGCHTSSEPIQPLQLTEVDAANNNRQVEHDGTVESTVQPKSKGNTKSRKPRQPATKAQGQKTLAEVLKPSATDVTPADHEDTWDEHEANGRRKRRRTDSYNAPNATDQSGDMLLPATEGATQATSITVRSSSPHGYIPPLENTGLDVIPNAEPPSVQLPGTPPKKMLKLNAGGKLLSPGSKSIEDEKIGEAGPRRRGRPRKAKEPEPQKTRVVVFKYGKQGETNERTLFGQRIGRILDGQDRIPEPAPIQKKTKATRKAKPTKPTHPLFIGKQDEKVTLKEQHSHKTSAATPGKLRRQALQDRVAETTKEVPYAIDSALLRDRLMVKHPGAKEPMWPDKSQAHVRGLDDEVLRSQHPHVPNKRKQKQLSQAVPVSDSLLDTFTAQLQPENEPEQRDDGYAGPRRDLRLPKKLLMSGEELLSRVSKELKAAVQDAESDELVESGAKIHPSVQKLCSALPQHLSAFDHCTGEMQGWTHKYAPTTALEVLQPKIEMAVLRDWLQALKVNTVEAAPATSSAPKATAKSKKKRRRPADELDDFLVDDDSVLHEMDSVPETVETEAQSAGITSRSIVQASNGFKVSNAVLISGPHGCGKTASAYAVAKELGYQIFEISSAERRSGRDVVDRVGDMTENHIVKHHGIDPGETSASEDHSHIEAAFQKDLDSGRQGKMSAFFKKQPDAKPSTTKTQTPRTKTIEKLQKVLKQPTKDQQQSLILLEEVDVLFKEDKEFWNTVFKLLATSKRPFIMTCNDEDLVPLQAMELHAVLRLVQPSVDSATDLMLLIAAIEGHLLKREAVTSLFESKDGDLRSSIAELDFWCQMGVGDPKSGLSWVYQRYPPGSDLDNQGRKLRLISDGTFQTGMGLVQPGTRVNEDTMLLAYQEFGVQPTSVMGWSNAPPIAPEPRSSTVLATSLRNITYMADSLSAMDMYTTHDTKDASLPELPAKSRTHYIEGMALLESNEKIDYEHMSEKLAISSALLTYGAYCRSDAVEIALQPSNLLSCIQNAGNDDGSRLTRRDFACFDAISTTTSSAVSSGLEQSAFDGPLEPLVTDLAPYVRSIAQYDLSLEEQRARLGEIVGEGPKAKRARTTRAARSALEGSQRGNTRGERWFIKDLNLEAVLATGGVDWPKPTADMRDEIRDGSEAPASSMSSVASMSI